MRGVVGAFVVVAVTALTAGTAFALKVQPNAATVHLTEGTETTVQFTLDEPIIAPTPSPNVTLDFTVDDPTRVSLDTSSLVWQDNEWFQTRTIYVTAIHDGVHDSSGTVTVHATATSASEYYNGFSTSFTVQITDIDPAPTTTSSSTTTSTSGATSSTTLAVGGRRGEMPATGTGTSPLAVCALGAIATGAVLASRRRRVTR